MGKTIDMSVSLCGIHLSNPLILAAGPYGRDSHSLARAAKAGFGAVTTKTIRLTAAENPYPNMALISRENFINAEKWSDLPLEAWIEHDIRETKRLGVPVIASLGLTEKEVRKIAPLVEEAGADFIEIVSYDVTRVLPMLKVAKFAVEVPVIVKVSANWPELPRIAANAEALGADAISAIDSIGPVLAIDIEKGRPYMGSVGGEGWLSGPAIHLVALKSVATVARKVKIPIIGIGGVSRGRDAVDMIMAGASCVGLCTAILINGLKVVHSIKQELGEFMKQKGYFTLREFRGLAQREIDRQDEESTTRLHPEVDLRRCTLCSLCVNLCPHQALNVKKDRVVSDRNKCLSCGLCYSVCPRHAITLLGD